MTGPLRGNLTPSPHGVGVTGLTDTHCFTGTGNNKPAFPSRSCLVCVVIKSQTVMDLSIQGKRMTLDKATLWLKWSKINMRPFHNCV